MMVGDILWKVDDNEPIKITGADMEFLTGQADGSVDESNPVVGFMQDFASNMKALSSGSTLASGEKAKMMLYQLVRGSNLAIRRFSGNSEVGMFREETSLLGLRPGKRGKNTPFPIDASFHEALKACNIEIEFGEVRRGRIGVIIADITPGLMEAFDLSTLEGALVNDVVDDSPADKAGLQPGDIIVGFNGEDIRDASDIRNAVGLVRPGTAADLVFLRDDRRRTVRIEVGMFEEQRDVLGEGAEDDIPAMESFSGASITGIPDDLDLRGGDSGVYVESVRRGSRAARSGLAAGDIIRKVDKTEVASLRDFEDAIRDKTGPIALTVERNGTNLFLAVR